MAVEPVGEEALGRPVRSRGDVLRVGQLAVDPPAGPEVDQLHLVVLHHYVLWLDIPVEDPVLVHVVQGLEQLEHELSDEALRKGLFPLAHQLVQVFVHELEDHGEAAGFLVTNKFIKAGIFTRGPRGAV